MENTEQDERIDNIPEGDDNTESVDNAESAVDSTPTADIHPDIMQSIEHKLTKLADEKISKALSEMTSKLDEDHRKNINEYKEKIRLKEEEIQKLKQNNEKIGNYEMGDCKPNIPLPPTKNRSELTLEENVSRDISELEALNKNKNKKAGGI